MNEYENTRRLRYGSEDWPRLRSLLRRHLLTGSVSHHDASYDTPRSHANGGGVDSAAHCSLWSALLALKVIRSQNRVAHQLLVREIGRPCVQRSHEVPQGHCHRIPLREMPLLAEMSWEEAERETERAVQWLVSVVT